MGLGWPESYVSRPELATVGPAQCGCHAVYHMRKNNNLTKLSHLVKIHTVSEGSHGS